MNILIFSQMVWDNTNSLGNTMSNFFDGEVWKNDNFYHIYMRSFLPNNAVCKSYYQMTLIDMLKNFFSKEKIGRTFSYNQSKKIDNLKTKKDQKYIDIIHKYSLNGIYTLADFMYRQKKWLNNRFKEYINNVQPDIFFAFLTDVSILYPIIKYLKENTNAKIVLFAADDIYGSFDNIQFYRRNKLRKEFKEVVYLADKLYGISNEICDKYSEMFSKRFEVLHKGCSFDYSIKKDLNKTLKFVYAGNLFYGRDDILAQVAQAIDNSNKINDQKAMLEIYTGDTITDDLKKKLNIKKSSIIMGSKNYKEIKQIMNKADYNLVVESFEQKQIDYVKYSFSTKIIDCLQSGSAFIGIGPNSISTIKYIKSIPGTDIIDNIDDIQTKVIEFIKNKNDILKNAKLIRTFALNNHGIEKNQKKLRDDFLSI